MSDPLHEAMLTLDPIIGVRDESYFGYSTITYAEAYDAVGYTNLKAEYDEARRLLQVFGTEVGRNLFGENVWSDIMKRRVSEASVTHDVVVTGIRFPNEVTAIRELGGELWWVERPDPNMGIEGGHASENSVSRNDFEVLIQNFGTLEALYAKVDIYR